MKVKGKGGEAHFLDIFMGPKFEHLVAKRSLFVYASSEFFVFAFYL